MTYIGNRDYDLEVRRGNVPGHAKVSVRAHDEALTTTKTTVHPGGVSGDIDQSAIFATPAVVGVASTDNTNDAPAGTGALTVRVTGLNSSGVPATEDITMNGQTAVNTVATFSAVFALTVLTTGSGNSNVGTLWCGTGTFTAGVPAVKLCSMDPGENQSQTGYYVVPTGKKLYLQHFRLTVSTTNKEVEVWIESSTDGSQWKSEGRIGLETGSFQGPMNEFDEIAADTHLRVVAESSAAGTDITVMIGAELVDD
jgi:hypothetical protein